MFNGRGCTFVGSGKAIQPMITYHRVTFLLFSKLTSRKVPSNSKNYILSEDGQGRSASIFIGGGQ
jgi:hypothetical protein